MHNEPGYVGIDNEIRGAMTDTAKIIRDGWVFGLIPESETCAGWRRAQIVDLWEKVDAEWEKYGFSVGRLPEDLRARFLQIQTAAIERAKAEGWCGADELQDDS